MRIQPDEACPAPCFALVRSHPSYALRATEGMPSELRSDRQYETMIHKSSRGMVHQQLAI